MTTCPDSDEVLPADADRDAWLDTRREGIGGSDASTIAGVNPYTTLYELWLDKTGYDVETRYTPEMRFGHLIEPVASQVFTEDIGVGVTLSGLQRSRSRPWQQHTPDGLTDDGGLLEIKSVGWREAHNWDDGQVADHAEVQVQHGMAVTGLTHAWVVAVIEREFIFRRVERNQAFIDLITDMERDFWERHVLGGEEPALVAADLDTVRARWPRARDGDVKVSETEWLPDTLAAYRAATDAAKRAADEKARIEAELTDYIGHDEAAGWFDRDGDAVIAVTRKNITRAGLDSKALRVDHPDIYQQYATETTYRRLSVLARPRKAR